MKVALFGNVFRPEKSAQASRVIELLVASGCEIFCAADYYYFLHDDLQIPFEATPFAWSCPEADIAISLGGDGTFLNTAHRVGQSGMPILGINMGRLGFLADVSSQDLEIVLTEVLKNYYRIEERTVLELSTHVELTDAHRFGLNEISIHKRDSSSMISISTWINDEFLTTYQADGLLISTPTGSTAYAMSVGGPIVMPGVDNLILTPVAPHSLNMRPIVISDDSEIRLKVESRDRHFLVGTDGRSLVLEGGIELTIKKAFYKLKLIKRHGHNHYSTLRNKLMWGKSYF